MPLRDLRQRQIHLDFHTGPAIPDVGADFDAREFARTMKRAHVNSVTVFAKCHHGHLYFNTRHPARHPGLKKDLDLLGGQVDALHREGIRAPIYISVQCDEYAANTHPEWVARNADSTQVKWAKDVFTPGWQIVDMSSPYQDYLAAQTAAVLERFKPVDGIFFDMCWDQPSTTKWALAAMAKRGLDPRSDADRAKYAHQVTLAYMKRFYQMVKASAPQATVYFNSRPLVGVPEEKPWLTHVEIEALATGGWGYLYFPKNVRFARNFQRPTMGMTARFHKSWADFGGLKPWPALAYEVSQMLAHGASCSIGDQLHPRGHADQAVYDLIGCVYGYAEACEPWTARATALTQVGVLRARGGYHDEPGCPIDGATRMLMQLKHQFDILHQDAALERYDLIILPEDVKVDEKLAARLRGYLKQGGTLIAALQPEGPTPASGGRGACRAATELLPELGVEYVADSPFTVTYFRGSKQLGKGLPATNHVLYERGVRVKTTRGATALAHVIEPYFERAWDHFCSHFQTPYRSQPSSWPAVVRRGNIITVTGPIFRAYGMHGNIPYRTLVKNCLDLLLPHRLVTVDAPSTTEVTVMRQANRTVVHLLQFVAERRANNLDLIEDVVPLHDIKLALRLPRPPRRVYLAPQKQSIPFEIFDSQTRVVVPKVTGHQMVVFES